MVTEPILDQVRYLRRRVKLLQAQGPNSRDAFLAALDELRALESANGLSSGLS